MIITSSSLTGATEKHEERMDGFQIEFIKHEIQCEEWEKQKLNDESWIEYNSIQLNV